MVEYIELDSSKLFRANGLEATYPSRAYDARTFGVRAIKRLEINRPCRMRTCNKGPKAYA